MTNWVIYGPFFPSVFADDRTDECGQVCVGVILSSNLA